jgi:ribosomal protein L7/L12
MSIAPDPLPQDVLDALSRGYAIDAIKLLRQSSGLGMKEAKDAIDAHLHGNPPSAPAANVGYVGPLPETVLLALRGGNKIEAIRLLRQATGLGLKEAKDAVDSFEQGTKPRLDEIAPGEISRKSGFIWWVVAAIVIAAVAFQFLRSHA